MGEVRQLPDRLIDAVDLLSHLRQVVRAEAVGVLAEAARAEAVKALRGGNKPDSIAKLTGRSRLR